MESETDKKDWQIEKEQIKNNLANLKTLANK